MARGTTKRDRVLTGDELRAFWRAAERWVSPSLRLLRFTLLTATRRKEAAAMRWSEIAGDIWTIPAARYKTDVELEVPVSMHAQNVLAGTVTKIGSRSFVLTTSGKTGIGGFSNFKLQFEPRMLEELRKIAADCGEDPAKVVLPRWDNPRLTPHPPGH
jgi:integrase